MSNLKEFNLCMQQFKGVELENYLRSVRDSSKCFVEKQRAISALAQLQGKMETKQDNVIHLPSYQHGKNK